jgi:hypothetical protein
MCDCSAFTVGGVHGKMVCLSWKLRISNSAKMSVGRGYECTKNLTVVSRIVSLSRGLEILRDCRNLWFL